MITFQKAENLIEKSRSLLDLQFNWDDSDARTISKMALEESHTVLRSLVHDWYEKYTDELPLPFISPVPDGSVDLFWDVNKHRILVNFAENNSSVVIEFCVAEKGNSNVFVPHKLSKILDILHIEYE